MRSFDYSRLYDKAWETDILNLVAKIHERKGRQDLFIRQSLWSWIVWLKSQRYGVQKHQIKLKELLQQALV